MFGRDHEKESGGAPQSGERSAAIAVLISHDRCPRYLELSLASLAAQREAVDQLEVVVTDNGSEDDTIEVVARFAAQVPFSVKMTTHRRAESPVARCRNEGFLVSHAPYVLLTDGNCVFPPNHVAEHLGRRKPHVVMAGDCCRLSKEVSRAVDPRAVVDGRFTQWASITERRRLAKLHRKAVLYNLLRHPTKPQLGGNDVGVWRSDYAAVNGYDEQFAGRGCEHTDLGRRLRRIGVKTKSIVKWTCAYQLWGPVEPTRPDRPREVLKLGDSRTREDSSVSPPLARRPFAELVFCPGTGQFSGRAAWNVLVVSDSHIVPMRQAAAAHVIITPAEAGQLLDRLARREAASRARPNDRTVSGRVA